jgi:vacuolar-type H+-ATPase subunit E/Vma4
VEARQACIDKLGSEVGSKLGEVSKAEGKYKQICIDLIVQGCLKLMEDDVTVKCRAADARVVSSCFAEAQNNYAKAVARATNVTPKLRLSLDKEVLGADCLGGVVLHCQNGAITVDNTLDTRLKLCMENDKPALRSMMFPQ